MGVVILLLLAVVVAVGLAVLLFVGLMVSLAVLIVRALTRRPLRRPARWAAPPPQRGRWPVRAGGGDVVRQLPPDVRAQADRIRLKAEGLLRQRDRFAAGSRHLYVVQRTITDYLPRTLSAYLDLPAGQEDLAVTPDGSTALQVLRGQLELLEGRLDEIARDLYRRNLDRLFANGRFLEERVGQPASELDLPVS
jgi:hypothetical protein